MIGFSQVLPSFQFGLKGGANLSSLSTENTFSSDKKAGYYAGIWTRIGAAGIHLQPEMYFSEKHTTLKSATGIENKVALTSIDVPVLLGTKIGAAGVGIRLNTGPVASFVLDKEQDFEDATGEVFKGNFKDQNFAWQFGLGLDIGKLGLDLRYETGLSKIGKDDYEGTKLNLFTLGLALRLF